MPDLDIIADAVFKKIGITVLIPDNPIKHGDFHNIAVLLLFAAQLWGLYFNPIIDHLHPISSPFSSIFPQS